MTERSVQHAQFVIERDFDAAPAKLFAAFADPGAKRAWFVGPGNWDTIPHKLDFRVGGSESVGGGPAGGPFHTYDARIQEIVANERIVSTYTMHMDATLISVSLVSIEIKKRGKGARLVYSEQIALLDGHDTLAAREEGTRELFGNLADWLAHA
jgi:uncharacterized protein YndB with AHSA1/START domain